MSTFMNTLSDALQFRREERATEGKVKQMPARANNLIYREDATPPFDKFDELRRDRPFKNLWDHKTDLVDQEAYDRAITEFALGAGWSDQEVVNLIIYHRTEQIEDLNLGSNYYSDLLARVKGDAAAVAPESDSADTSKDLELLNRALKLRIAIKAVRKYGANLGTYELELENGRRVNLGDAAALLSYRTVKAALLDSGAGPLPLMKTQLWDKVCDLVDRCSGPPQVEEAPEVVEVRWLLSARLPHVSVLDVDELDRTALAKFIRQVKKTGHWAFRSTQTGRILIQIGGFTAAVRLNHGRLMSFKECGTLLGRLGWRDRKLDGEDNDGRESLRCWECPQGWKA
jgi:hypothetical protein